MRLEGRSRPAASTAQESRWTVERITWPGQGTSTMYDTLHLPARLVPRLRVTSPQPPRSPSIATAQERDACPFGLIPINLPRFATTHAC
jgi:hypothetical protein